MKATKKDIIKCKKAARTVESFEWMCLKYDNVYEENGNVFIRLLNGICKPIFDIK